MNPSLLRDVFHAALELEGPERIAYVHSACGGDVALLREVAALLQAAAEAGAFLSGDPPHLAPDGVPATLPTGRTVPLADAKAGADAEDSLHVPATATRGGDAAIERYVLGRELGRGGLGRVVIAFDRSFMGREVAMKLMLGGTSSEGPASPGSSPGRERFLEEAQITGRLWHPNIVPVLEIGERPGGEPYYTMPVIRGTSMEDAIRESHRKVAVRELHADAWGIERLQLLDAFRGLCHAVEYSHSRGVIHRDVKPANVMLGDFGETILVDWGLAKVIPARATEASTAEQASGKRADRRMEDLLRGLRAGTGHQTVEGTITGTPAYMSPEQATGRISEIDERSDVYALGAVLFAILTGKAPYEERSLVAILRKLAGPEPSPDPRQHAGDVAVPDDLADVCARAMSKRKEDRYATPAALLADLAEAIDGSKERIRRRTEAGRLVAMGRESARDLGRLGDEHRRLVETAKLAGSRFKGGEPVREKQDWWQLQDEARALESAIAWRFAEAERHYHQALERVHDHRDAREGLADLYYDRFRAAEDGHQADAQYYQALVETYHDGKYAREIAGDGSIAFVTDPPGAEVHLYRYQERERRLLPVPWKAPVGWAPELRRDELCTSAGWYLTPSVTDRSAFLGTTPIAPFPVPMGSYLTIVRGRGFRDVRRPVHVARNHDVAVTVRLYADEVIGDPFVFVPGGDFIADGDRDVVSSRARTSQNVEDFFIARFPVTCSEYLAFLNDVATRDPAEARRLAPRWQDRGTIHWIEDKEGVWQLPAGKDDEGFPWALDEPVVEVNWHDAREYCAWRSAKEGRAFRLPTGAEWEKAARGVDGRFFPWGNHFDASWCNMAHSRLDGPARRGPIAEFPIDESPYGVRGLAGNVGDWCADLLRGDQTWRIVRGGNWMSTPVACRSAYLIGAGPTNPFIDLGFRLAISAG